jgi:purine-binding chemotaxis protein CheW
MTALDAPLEASVAALLKRRAEVLRAPLPKGDDEAVLWVAQFPVGDEHFALPLASLRSAVSIKLVTPLPLTAPHVLGIMRYEGQIISCFSLSALLGGRGWRSDPKLLLVLDPGWGHLAAVDCEQTPDPVSIPQSLVDQAKGQTPGLVTEVTTRDRKVVKLIDVSALLDQRGGKRRGD